MREGIRSLLHLLPDVTVVAAARDGEEAFAVIPTVGADVVLLDLNLPERSGIEGHNAQPAIAPRHVSCSHPEGSSAH